MRASPFHTANAISHWLHMYIACFNTFFAYVIYKRNRTVLPSQHNIDISDGSFIKVFFFSRFKYVSMMNKYTSTCTLYGVYVCVYLYCLLLTRLIFGYCTPTPIHKYVNVNWIWYICMIEYSFLNGCLYMQNMYTKTVFVKKNDNKTEKKSFQISLFYILYSQLI